MHYYITKYLLLKSKIASYVMYVEFYVNVFPCPYFIGTENIHYGYYNNAKEFVLRAIQTLWNIKMPHYLGIWNILDWVYHVFLVCSTNHLSVFSSDICKCNPISIYKSNQIRIWPCTPNNVRKWNCVWVSVAKTFIQY